MVIIAPIAALAPIARIASIAPMEAVLGHLAQLLEHRVDPKVARSAGGTVDLRGGSAGLMQVVGLTLAHARTLACDRARTLALTRTLNIT